jgi:hypothetical protein
LLSTGITVDVAIHLESAQMAETIAASARQADFVSHVAEASAKLGYVFTTGDLFVDTVEVVAITSSPSASDDDDDEHGTFHANITGATASPTIVAEEPAWRDEQDPAWQKELDTAAKEREQEQGIVPGPASGSIADPVEDVVASVLGSLLPHATAAPTVTAARRLTESTGITVDVTIRVESARIAENIATSAQKVDYALHIIEISAEQGYDFQTEGLVVDASSVEMVAN